MFEKSKVTTEDQVRYAGLIKSGDIEQALDEFIAKYVTPFIDEYQDKVTEFMQFIKDQEMSESKTIIGITLATVGLSLLLKNGFKILTSLYTKQLTKDIKSDEVKNRISETALNRFNEQIDGTMNKTSQNVINAIREIQSSFIIEESRLRSQGLKGQDVQAGIESFKTQLKNKFPDIEEMIKNKSFLKSSPDKNGVSRNYKLDSYIEQSIRTAILDVDRISNEIMATVNGDLVMEYFKRDNRIVKTKERNICKRILNEKIFGVSLLALTDEVASILGIMTVDQARNTADYAMSYNCRHAVRRASKEINDKIRNMLKSEAA